MNILTFDIEEWYLEKELFGDRKTMYPVYEHRLDDVLDLLDTHHVRATFFCVGMLAKLFPEVVKKIASRGHEIGCHSNQHTWLTTMDETTLHADTTDAIHALEDAVGQKVVSYRAPAFSISADNKWAFDVLAECGIENDASIFPATRDFGGYPSFPYDTPCIIKHGGVTMHEFPVPMTSLLGRRVPFSGGGYIRVLPYHYVRRTMQRRDYTICYFHLKDLMDERVGLLSKADYEDYFHEEGSLKNRLSRYVKDNISGGDAFKTLCRLMADFTFTGIPRVQDEMLPTVEL